MALRKVVVLGLGMQGKAALYDLVQNTDGTKIVVADAQPGLEAHLTRYPADRVEGCSLDASDPRQLARVCAGAQVVLECLPGTFALPVARLAADLGVHLVSSMYYLNPEEEDNAAIARGRDELGRIDRRAREHGVTLLPEFGLDPGIDLVVARQALSELDEVDEFYSYGAGFPAPEAAQNPLGYKFTWSIAGVLKSYRRPARIITGGKVRAIAGLEQMAPENRHALFVEELGAPLECYPNGNSAHYAEVFGLAGKVREMARYTCRWPGHCDFWQKMAGCGFLDAQPLRPDVPSPLEFTAALLDGQPQFHFADNEQDVTLTRIDVRGLAGGEKKRVVYQAIDRRDLATGFTSMQRTVGFTMSLGARLILDGALRKRGLISPIDVPYALLAEGLGRHGITIERTEPDGCGAASPS